VTWKFTWDSWSYDSLDAQGKNYSESSPGGGEYQLKTPLRLTGAVAWHNRLVTLDLEGSWINWAEARYAETEVVPAARDNLRIARDYGAVSGFRAGLEVTIPRTDLQHRTGASWQPLAGPYSIRKERRGFSFGAGYLIDEVVEISAALVLEDAAFSYAEPADSGTRISEDRRDRWVVLGFYYRF